MSETPGTVIYSSNPLIPLKFSGAERFLTNRAVILWR
jgi:hypothetical protein